VALGWKDGRKGGKARWAGVSPKDRSEILRRTVQARWGSGRAVPETRSVDLDGPGVLPDRFPWGPALAYVTIPRVPMKFLVVRSIEDVQDQPYREVEGVWPFAHVLARTEVPGILQELVSPAQLDEVVVKIDLALGLAQAGDLPVVLGG
jgi:hypothetical protein